MSTRSIPSTMVATVIAAAPNSTTDLHMATSCEAAILALAAQVGCVGSFRGGRWCQFRRRSEVADHAQIATASA